MNDLKINLCLIIKKIIENKKLTQIEAAEIMEIDQAKVSKIINKKTYSFSIERLFNFLNFLGYDVFINIKDGTGKITLNE